MRGKTKFDCGHRGHGQFCHRCKQADVFLAKAKKLKSSKKLDLMLEACRLKATSGEEDKTIVDRLVGLGVEREDAWHLIGQGVKAKTPEVEAPEAVQEA